MVKVIVQYMDITDNLTTLKKMEFDYPKGTSCSEIPKYVFKGYEFVRTSYVEDEVIEGQSGYIVYYQWVGLTEEFNLVADGLDLKRTKYVRRIQNGIGLIVHPTTVAKEFDIAKPAKKFGLVSVETVGNVRTFIYERKEVIENMEDLKELDINEVNKGFEGISEETTEALVQEAVRPEGVEVPKPKLQEDVVLEQEDVVESARNVVLCSLKQMVNAVRGASKEQLVAGGVVTAIVVFKVVRRLVRK